MKNIEKYIPIALRVLEYNETGIVEKGKINKTYNGYISSFGASIISSGLLPTLIFYSKKAEGSDSVDRSLIVKAIEKMLKSNDIDFLAGEEKLLEEVITRYNDYRLKKKIQECAIALKLAIRTYPQSERNKSRFECCQLRWVYL
jgi:CRISPR-associated protein Cmr5